mmetsp:Transcript_14769/g.43687  ORF Transcript_14769/g.43687 Transcript_14769/m.43687 type:complete len:330 (-) Transcript_14769:2402-3391(-)
MQLLSPPLQHTQTDREPSASKCTEAAPGCRERSSGSVDRPPPSPAHITAVDWSRAGRVSDDLLDRQRRLALRVGRRQRLLRAKHRHAQLGLAQPLCKRAEGLGRASEHLVAELLPHRCGDAGEVPVERALPLLVGRERLVEVTDHADNRLLECLCGDVRLAECVGGGGVDVKRGLQVWVAVRRECKAARRRIERATAAVCAARNADIVPQVAERQRARSDRRGAKIGILAWLEEAAAGGDVVHLRDDGVGLVLARRQRQPRPLGCVLAVRVRGWCGGHAADKGVQLRLGAVDGVGVGGEVDHEAVARVDGPAEPLQPREEGRPVVLRRG